MASKRKSKIKKGRSPSMAAQIKQLTDRVVELGVDLTALKHRVAELENTKTSEPATSEVFPST